MGAYPRPSPPRQRPSFDAAHVARALVLAAVLTDELSVLIKHDQQVLDGSWPLRARWVALAALVAGGHAQPFTVARALGCGGTPLFHLEQERQRPGWIEEHVVTVALSLISDTSPEGSHGLYAERSMTAALTERAHGR